MLTTEYFIEAVEMNTLQKRIKKQREKLDLTLAELGKRLGVAESTAQRYESGKIKNVKHNTIVKIAEALEVSPSYLMGWDEELETLKEEDPQMYLASEIAAELFDKDLATLKLIEKILLLNEVQKENIEATADLFLNK